MNFQDVLPTLTKSPLFESSLLYAGADSPQKVQRQLVDWSRAGKVIQLRRGLYTLAQPYQKERPHSYVIANQLVTGSYISLQMALSHYDLIPEHVAVVTSVTTGRPGKRQNVYGHFSYQHLQAALFFGFQYRQVSNGQRAYIATPEKALLDLIYLTPEADSVEYLRALRLQNLDQIDRERLMAYVGRAGKPKLQRALPRLLELIEAELRDYVPL